jgi:hypothetical protein
MRAAFTSANPQGTVAVKTQSSPYLLLCTYTDPASPKCTKAAVSINTGPSALTDFNRWTTETGQNAMWTGKPSLNPTPVAGIGILAEWVPATRTFAAASTNTWVQVVLTCAAKTTGDLALGKAIGKAGLASVG